MAIGPSPFGTGKIVDYTRAVELIPNKFGLVSSLGLFAGEGITTKTAIIDVVESVSGLLPIIQREGVSTRMKQHTVKQLAVVTPHISVEDYLYPKDVVEVRRPGSTEEDVLGRVRNQKLDKMSNCLDLTWEFFRMSALKGLTVGYDEAGNVKTLFDAYTELSATKTNVNIDFTQTTEDVPGKLLDIKRHIELNVFNGTMVRDIVCLCSPSYFDALTSHTTMKDAFKYYASTQNALREDVRADFVWKGIRFIEYNGSVLPPKASVAVPFITDKYAYFFPMGVSDMFLEYYSPVDDRLEYVNTRGIPKYAFEYADPEGKWIKYNIESQPLMINTRPQAVVESIGTIS